MTVAFCFSLSPSPATTFFYFLRQGDAPSARTPARLRAAVASDKHFLIGKKLCRDSHRHLRRHDFIFPYNYTLHSGVSRFHFLPSYAGGALNGLRPIFTFYRGGRHRRWRYRVNHWHMIAEKSESFPAELWLVIEVHATLKTRFVQETGPAHNDE